jgi:hypothetical protein
MIHRLSFSHHRRLGHRYIDKILSLGPVAYWPLNETSGTVAHCLVNSAQNGTFARDVSTMGTGPGIGDGNTSPRFDGTNDYADIDSQALVAAFSATAGTLFLWTKVEGTPTDNYPRGCGLTADGDNYVYATYGKNDLDYLQIYKAGGTSTYNWSQHNYATEVWRALTLTWNVAADEVKTYINGAQDGDTVTSLGTWAGSLGTAYIGCSGPGSNRWAGLLAHVAVADRTWTPTEIAALAVVP